MFDHSTILTGFQFWDEYWGLLSDDKDPRFTTKIFGFENVSNANRKIAEVPNDGAIFGYVCQGKITVSDFRIQWLLASEQWFALPSGCSVLLGKSSRVLIVQRLKFKGLYAMGGPIEELGRLKYIDGCSDTLLCSPPLLGDPCLNLLHFPGGIDQTAHTHPSTRVGIVARGTGNCITPESVTALKPGRIFCIPKDEIHSFQTMSDIPMDIIAYHPDSDWGPTHEDHPMVNRTLVQGAKIDNTIGIHASAQVENSLID